MSIPHSFKFIPYDTIVVQLNQLKKTLDIDIITYIGISMGYKN